MDDLTTQQSHSFTSNGLSHKNTRRIEEINTRTEIRLEVEVTSWQVSRALRRDFYTMAIGMYMKGYRKGKKRDDIQALLLELNLQASELATNSTMFEQDAEAVKSKIPLRLICHENSQLLTCLKIVDEAYARLNKATKAGLLTHQQRDNMIHGYVSTFNALKQYTTRAVSSDETANELGTAIGID